MSKSLLNRIDDLINTYRSHHKGENPLYIILSPDECKAIEKEIRKAKSYPDDYVITTYRDVKISSNLAIKDGEFYVGNDLPETGS